MPPIDINGAPAEKKQIQGGHFMNVSGLSGAKGPAALKQSGGHKSDPKISQLQKQLKTAQDELRELQKKMLQGGSDQLKKDIEQKTKEIHDLQSQIESLEKEDQKQAQEGGAAKKTGDAQVAEGVRDAGGVRAADPAQLATEMLHPRKFDEYRREGAEEADNTYRAVKENGEIRIQFSREEDKARETDDKDKMRWF